MKKILEYLKNHDVKACPFCGAKEINITIGKQPESADEPLPYGIECSECWGGNDGFASLKFALEWWNTRSEGGKYE